MLDSMPSEAFFSDLHVGERSLEMFCFSTRGRSATGNNVAFKFLIGAGDPTTVTIIRRSMAVGPKSTLEAEPT
jgi:hypothetical protein